jgi:predicted transcriptional regulator
MPFNFNRKKFSYGNNSVLSKDMLRASATLDFPSVAAAGSQVLTVTCTGARVGDDAEVFLDAPDAGLVYKAWVSANDTVSVRVSNLTAGAIDPASKSYRVIVFKAF